MVRKKQEKKETEKNFVGYERWNKLYSFTKKTPKKKHLFASSLYKIFEFLVPSCKHI